MRGGAPQGHEGLLGKEDSQISMDGKGRALDNIFTERLWRTVTYEEVYRYDYANPKEARQGLTRYIDFYNHRRPHQALGYQTPAEVYVAPAAAPRVNDNLHSPASRREKGAIPTLKCPSPVS